MEESIVKRLDSLVGKTFNYKEKNVTINSWKNVGGTNAVVFIDSRPHNFLMHEIEPFLESLYTPTEKEIKQTQITVSKNELSIYEPTAENKEVKATLLETLKRVKQDANYIPQAEAVCNVVNQIVNVQKTEIQMLNLLKKHKE